MLALRTADDARVNLASPGGLQLLQFLPLRSIGAYRAASSGDVGHELRSRRGTTLPAATTRVQVSPGMTGVARGSAPCELIAHLAGTG